MSAGAEPLTPAAPGENGGAAAKPDPPAAKPKTKRSYTVFQPGDDEGTVKIVGTYEGTHPDEACWAAIDDKFKARAEAAGKDAGEPAPSLEAVHNFKFAEYVLEPVQDTKRVKRG